MWIKSGKKGKLFTIYPQIAPETRIKLTFPYP